MAIDIIGVSSVKPYIKQTKYNTGLGKTLVFRPKTAAVKEAILKAAYYMQGDATKYLYSDIGLKWVDTVKSGDRKSLLCPDNKGLTHIRSLQFIVAVCRYAGISQAEVCNSFAALRDKLEKSKLLTKQSKVASQISLIAGDILIRPKSTDLVGYGYVYVGDTKRTSNNPSTSTSASKSSKSTKQSSNVKKEDLGEFARKLCWPSINGGSNPKGKYPSGKRTDSYDVAYKAIKSQLHIKDKKYQAGASCDVFVFAACRAYGISNFPNKLSAQCDYFFKSDKYKTYFTKVNTSSGSTSNMKSGDIVCRINKGSSNNGQGHILIVCNENGHKRTANGHHEKGPGYYGVVDGFSGKDKNSNPSKNKYYGVFRLKDGVALGDGSVAGGSGSYASDGTTVMGMDDGSCLVLSSIDKLFSTNRYHWGEQEEDDESQQTVRSKELTSSMKNFLSNIKVTSPTSNNVVPADVQITSIMSKASKQSEFKAQIYKGKSGGSKLTSFPSLVQAPYIDLSFNGIRIGGYGNIGDKFPNYINSLSVSKINGKINKYTIGLNYQIRPGEDPNFIDALLSKVGYKNPLKIRYGDMENPGLLFREEHCIVTDVKHKESVSSSSISYTISALSSVSSADQSYFTFPKVKGKPSTIINQLLFGNSTVSNQLREAFPAMTSRTFINSHNLIPTTDAEVTIGGMTNVTPLTYLSHVVSCMSNKNSSYFLSYFDNKEGAYFKISEVQKFSGSSQAGLYEINIGYPDDNFITNFQLCNNFYWPLVYEYNGKIPKWDYSYDSKGNLVSSSNNRLSSDNKYLSPSIINDNWWNSITEFPISAKVTLKGLTVPVMLMTYIRVNTLFYGQSDMASGLYVVTDQEDSVSGNGCTTTLTMLRVGE